MKLIRTAVLVAAAVAAVNKAKEYARDNPEAASGTIDKAESFVRGKAGPKYADTVGKGSQALRQGLGLPRARRLRRRRDDGDDLVVARRRVRADGRRGPRRPCGLRPGDLREHRERAARLPAARRCRPTTCPRRPTRLVPAPPRRTRRGRCRRRRYPTRRALRAAEPAPNPVPPTPDDPQPGAGAGEPGPARTRRGAVTPS